VLEYIGEMFDTDAQAVCITTNKFVKKNGAAVMGRGCAKQAMQLMPGIEFIVGHVNRCLSRNTALLTRSEPVGTTMLTTPFGGQQDYRVSFHVLMLTVKPDKVIVGRDKENIVSWNHDKVVPGYEAPGWMSRSSIPIIRQSLVELISITDKMGWTRVAVPRAGSGAGELPWPVIRALMLQLLDDRFIVYGYD